MSCRCGAHWTGHKIEHCPVCHSTFTGTAAGDRHRTGDHAVSVGPDRRRCLSTEEMVARGMAQNSRGVWMTSAGGGHFASPVLSRNAQEGGAGVFPHGEKTKPSDSGHANGIEG